MKKIGIILFVSAIVLFAVNFAIFFSQSAVATGGGWVSFGQIVSSIVCPLILIAGLVLVILGLILRK